MAQPLPTSTSASAVPAAWRSALVLAGACGLLLGAVTSAVATHGAAARWGGSEAPAAALDDAAGVLALAGVAALLAWVGVAVALTAIGLASAGRRKGRSCDALARRISPWLLRRLVTAMLGAATLAGCGHGAAPAASVPVVDRPAAVSVALSPSPGVDADTTQPRLATSLPPVADRPASPTVAVPASPAVPVPEAGDWLPVPPPRPQPAGASSATMLVTGVARSTGSLVNEVVVRRGDTLWAVAARHLQRTGRPSSTLDIAREWPRWWRANASVVGTDPDVLRPGQVLHAPGPPS